MLTDFLRGGLDLFNDTQTDVEDNKSVNPKAAALSEMYDPYRINPNETLVDYYKRLAEARKGGILGTGGMMDVAKQSSASPTKEISDAALGKLVKNVSEAAGGGDSELGMPTGSYSLNDIVDQITGMKYDPLSLFGVVGGPLGSLAAKGMDVYRQGLLEEEMKSRGFSQEEIDRLMSDKDALAATTALGRTTGVKNPDYNYFDVGQSRTGIAGLAGSVVDSLFGTSFNSGPAGSESWSPLSPVNTYSGGWMSPMTAMGDIANIQAAQRATQDAIQAGITKDDPLAVAKGWADNLVTGAITGKSMAGSWGGSSEASSDGGWGGTDSWGEGTGDWGSDFGDYGSGGGWI